MITVHMAGASPPIYVPFEQITLQCGSFGNKSRLEFTYTFPLSSSPKFIRLYFFPASYAPNFDRSQAVFSVKAGGFTLLHDFNASATADASASDTIYREFCLHTESGQNLNITFTPSTASPDAYAFINGLEIISMPPYLYYTSPQSPDGVAYVGSENTIRIENNTSLEMVYRINIGDESRIYSYQDTGIICTAIGMVWETSTAT